MKEDIHSEELEMDAYASDYKLMLFVDQSKRNV